MTRACRAMQLAFREDRTGSSAVEFALAAPIMILLSLGIVEFGRALLAYHEVSLAVFEAGRYAMVHGAGSGDPATLDDLGKVVKAQLHSVDPAQLQLTAEWKPSDQPGDFVSITVEYPFSFLINGLPDLTLRSEVEVIIAN